jgi:hypothetical protein
MIRFSARLPVQTSCQLVLYILHFMQGNNCTVALNSVHYLGMTMSFNEDLNKFLTDAHAITSELSLLAEKIEDLQGDDGVVVLSLIELIGATCVQLGTEMETGNEAGVKRVLAEASELFGQALSVLKEHTGTSAQKAPLQFF